MAQHCVPLGDVIAKGRPFVYLPKSFQVAVAAAINRVAKGCVFGAFVQTPCDVAREGEHGHDLCWMLNAGDPQYRATGLIGIHLALDVDGSSIRIPKILSLQGDVTVSAVGPLLRLPSGPKFEFFEGDCPSGDCVDQWVHGRLACEVTGSFRVSSDLKKYWNAAVILNWFFWTQFPGFLLGDATGDFIHHIGDNEVFQVTIQGTGPNGGAVYDLGPFELRPQ